MQRWLFHCISGYCEHLSSAGWAAMRMYGYIIPRSDTGGDGTTKVGFLQFLDGSQIKYSTY